MSEIVTDDFTRANGSLGANWVGGSWSIVGNQASCSATGSQAVLAVWTGGDDQYAQAQYVTTVMASLDFVGPLVRSVGVPAGLTGYAATVDGTNFVLQRLVGDYTSLASVVGGVLNDTLRCEVQGTTIRSVLNGVVQSSVTDAAIASGKPGFTCSAFTVTPVLDNFAAGDFAVPVPRARRGGLVPQQRML